MKTRKIIQKNGFTLFELLVSISIIGILTALGVVAFSSAQSKARDSRRVQDMDALQKAAEQYYGAVSPNAYPVDTTISNWTPSGGSPIFQIFPVDPKKVSPYLYNYQPVGSGYCACAKLENINATNANETTPGNCSAGVTFVATGTGAYYCVKNQQ